MTTREVSSLHRVQWWMLVRGTLPRVRTALVKAATRRPVRRRGDRSWNRAQPLVFLAESRHRGQQALGVRVMRLGEDAIDRRLLHDFAGVHDDDARNRL